jgi:hypothetical protein
MADRNVGYLDIVVLEPVPAVIDGHKDVRNYILLPTIENVLHMLEKVQMSGKVSQLIQTFNISISHDERSQFVEYISGYSKMNYHVVNLQASTDTSRYVMTTTTRFDYKCSRYSV